MKRLCSVLLLAVVALALLTPDGLAHKGHGHGAAAGKFGLKFRLSTMQALGVHMGILLAETRNEVVLTANRRQAHADAIGALSVLIKDLFQDETWQRTRAKQEIWQQWERFAGMAQEFEAASTALSAAAADDDLALVGDQLKLVGERCTACHKAFRKPKKGH